MGTASDQGWLEGDDGYRHRKRREADEATVERTTGTTPSQGFFELDERYEARARRAADEGVVEASTGSRPSQRWLEEDDRYAQRVRREANERTIEDVTGRAPKQGWFESDEDHRRRLEREADEAIVQRATGSKPKQRLLEGDGAYRRRIALEADEHAAASSSGDGEGDLVWSLVKLTVILGLLIAAVVIGLMVLAVALAIAAVASLVQLGYAEATRRRLGPAARLYARRGRGVVWIGVAAGLLAGLLAVPAVLQGGDGLAVFVLLAGLVAGAYLSYRASGWISERRLRSVDPATLLGPGLVEPHPALLYSVGGVLALAYVGGGLWLSNAAGGAASSYGGADYAEEAFTGTEVEPYSEGPPSWSETAHPRPEVAAGPPAFAPPFVYANAPGDGFLAIRSAPSTSTGERLDAIPHRGRVEVLNVAPVPDRVDEIAGRWLYIRHGDVEGWVFEGYVSEDQPPPMETVAVNAWGVVNEPEDGHLNLRAWPSLTSRIEGELPHGSRVYVEACRPESEVYSRGNPGRWCQVRQDGRSGWAFDAYIDGVGS